jgi:uncharacterized membrane protein YfcA
MMLAVLLGAAVGLILALTGAGGGMLAVPLLMFSLGLGVSEAAPVALLAVGLAAALGALMGLRFGHLRYRAAGFMALLGIAGAPLGWWLGRHAANAPLALLFSAVLVYTSWRMLRLAGRGARHATAAPHAMPPCRIDPVAGRLRWTAACARALGSTGFAAGVLSSLLGVGGGFVIVPALLRVTDLDMQSIAVTSMAVIALVSAGSIVVSLLAGTALPLAVALPFAAGALAGLLLGRRLAQRLSGPRLQQAFAVLGLAVALLMAWRAAQAF